MTDPEITRFGFKFGAAEYVRACAKDGYSWVLIRTPRREMEIRVSPSGFIRASEPRKVVTPKGRK